MKSLLNYQVSEYDCGPTCMMNAFKYLYHREEIPVEVIKLIFNYTMDGLDKKRIFGGYGTSDFSIKYICAVFNDFAKKTDFDLKCETIENKEVCLKNIKFINCLKDNGVVIIKCMIGIPHFVLITDIIDDDVYVFDPYYRKRPFNDERIKIINLPFKANRKIKIDAMDCEKEINFALGKSEDRLALLIKRGKSL